MFRRNAVVCRSRLHVATQMLIIFRAQEAVAKQAAWEQEQARIARDRHVKETDELKAAEALAG